MIPVKFLCGMAAGMMAGCVLTATIPAATAGAGHVSRTDPFVTDTGDGTVPLHRSVVETHAAGVWSGPGLRLSRLAYADTGHRIRAHILNEVSDGLRIAPVSSSRPFPRVEEGVEGSVYCDASEEAAGEHGEGRRDRNKAAALSTMPSSHRR